MMDKTLHDHLWGYYVGQGSLEEPTSKWRFLPARDWGLPLWEFGSLQPTSDGGWNLLLGKWLGYIDEQGYVHYHALLQLERLKEPSHVTIRLTIPPWFRRHYGQLELVIARQSINHSSQHWADPYILPKAPSELADPGELPF
jgi:hypothetical protein